MARCLGGQVPAGWCPAKSRLGQKQGQAWESGPRKGLTARAHLHTLPGTTAVCAEWGGGRRGSEGKKTSKVLPSPLPARNRPSAKTAPPACVSAPRGHTKASCRPAALAGLEPAPSPRPRPSLGDSADPGTRAALGRERAGICRPRSLFTQVTMLSSLPPRRTGGSFLCCGAQLTFYPG